jgi:hypothetical protein
MQSGKIERLEEAEASSSLENGDDDMDLKPLIQGAAEITPTFRKITVGSPKQ